MTEQRRVRVGVGTVHEMPHPTPGNPNNELPGVVVSEADGSRAISFTMTPEQGRALARAQNGEHGSRPMTPDLIVGLLEVLGATLEQATITSADSRTVLAELTLRTITGTAATVDCRPSDPLILAERLGAPVFADDHVLREQP